MSTMKPQLFEPGRPLTDSDLTNPSSGTVAVAGEYPQTARPQGELSLSTEQKLQTQRRRGSPMELLTVLFASAKGHGCVDSTEVGSKCVKSTIESQGVAVLV